MHQTMKSYGPIGVLTDSDNLDEEVEPGSDSWGFENCLNLKSISFRIPRKVSVSSKRRFPAQMSRYDSGQIVVRHQTVNS